MMKLTFKNQVILGLAVALVWFLCWSVTKLGVFCNLGWVLYAALFVIHPVYPHTVTLTSWQRRSVQLLGLAVVGAGLWTRFDV